MKKKISKAIAETDNGSASTQTIPPSRPRSAASFTQVDDFLSVIRGLGIPTADGDILEGQTDSSNAAKIVYNTTLNKLRVYNPVTAQWRDAIEADLTNYYTKSQVDSLLSGIDISKYVKVDDFTVGSGFGIINENGEAYFSPASISLQNRIPGSEINSKFVYNLGQLQINVDQSGNNQEATLNAYQLSGVLFSPTSYAQYNYGVGGFGFHRSTNDYIRGFGIRLPESGNTALQLTTPLTGTTIPVEKVLPLSVNGHFADVNGNITIPTSSGNYVKVDEETTGSGFTLSTASSRFEAGAGKIDTYTYDNTSGQRSSFQVNGGVITSAFTIADANLNTSLSGQLLTGTVFSDTEKGDYSLGLSGLAFNTDANGYKSFNLGFNPESKTNYKINIPVNNKGNDVSPEERTLPLSVNGVYADKYGSIELPLPYLINSYIDLRIRRYKLKNSDLNYFRKNVRGDDDFAQDLVDLLKKVNGNGGVSLPPDIFIGTIFYPENYDRTANIEVIDRVGDNYIMKFEFEFKMSEDNNYDFENSIVKGYLMTDQYGYSAVVKGLCKVDTTPW